MGKILTTHEISLPCSWKFIIKMSVYTSAKVVSVILLMQFNYIDIEMPFRDSTYF